MQVLKQVSEKERIMKILRKEFNYKTGVCEGHLTKELEYFKNPTSKLAVNICQLQNSELFFYDRYQPPGMVLPEQEITITLFMKYADFTISNFEKYQEIYIQTLLRVYFPSL